MTENTEQTNEMSNAELDAIALELDRGAGALAAVHSFVGRFVSYPSPHAQVAHAAWILHAWLMDRWVTTPRLAFLSPEPGSGKSRALEITQHLSRNPVNTVNCSPAYLFRKIGEPGGTTILYDEIDTVFGPKAKDNEDIRGLLNAGHRRGATVGRCVVSGKTVETEEIAAYAPVALAGLGWLPDTILTRSIVIRMRKRKPDEPVEPFRERTHGAEAAALRIRIERWAGAFPVEIERWPELPAGISDRNADVWEPLIAIGDHIGGEWGARIRNAAVASVAAAQDRDPSIGVLLLQDCRTAFGDMTEMPTTLLLNVLTAMKEAPWASIAKGQPLDARGLAKQLGEFGIKPVVIRVGDATPRGYRRADFCDAWDRYCPLSPATGATSETSATEAAAHVAPVADVADLREAQAAGPRPKLRLVAPATTRIET